jgi:hypothetical protein
MLIIPHKKIKFREATMTYMLDPTRLKTFIMDLRAYLRSTQHSFKKNDSRITPETVSIAFYVIDQKR